jgi:hypothetical protein
MKFIQKIPINGFRTCCNILFSVFVCIFVFSVGKAQSPPHWIEISLVDTIPYAQFGTDHISNNRYPPSACFDGDVVTCWVSGTGTDTSSLYLRLPERDNLVLNLFAGYGKSKKLYELNSRPKSIRLSILAAVNPDGFVSEKAMLYKAVRFSQTQTVQLADRFGIQSIPLDFAPRALAEFKKRVLQQYDKNFNIPKADSCLILQMEIVDTRPGSRYKDVCISEIYFNDCLLSPAATGFSPIKNVYLNRAENELLLDDADNRGVIAYRDTAAVLQIMDISPDNRWAVVISMPAEIEGRAETTYLLFDLVARELMNTRLEKQTGNYLSGNDMYIETGDNGRVYLNYSGTDFNFHKIELR